ncbi:hypothetical protein DFQ28_005488 [Apophysomyces sp. BC1034]|nr:hypothetical protein DFQ30_005310 [Apophysomyces sp. BC1015]KAG0177837.1 hypothetical protein DFQ29_004283 [Apophysomyces sp. BC1021]KAG0188020.1 hypothetical protein DFQ28_005488 [Apophysomyces sp. BC1034]
MGLLKLGSIYGKKKNKEKQRSVSTAAAPPLPLPTSPPPSKLQPLTLDLDFESTQPQLTKKPVTTPLTVNKSVSATRPVESGSLFDDIFSELKGKPAEPIDGLQSDLSLAVALSQQLQLDAPITTKLASATPVPQTLQKPTASKPDFLSGNDSIYSSYLLGLRSLEQTNDTNTNHEDTSFGTSIFASLMQSPSSSATPTATSRAPTATVQAPAKPTPPVATQVVLDSDVSDSDDSDDSDSEEEEYKSQGLRMTKGARPIMERRTQDHRLMVKRKVDSWVNRVDPEANVVESNDSMIARMKDRHRQQVKMAVVRQQQQQQQSMGMMPYPIAPGFGLGPVPQHPAMMSPTSPPHLYAPQLLPEFVDPNTSMYPLPNEAPAPAKPSVSRSSLPTSTGLSVESDTRSTTSTTTPPSSSTTSSTCPKDRKLEDIERDGDGEESQVDADDETSDDNASRGTKRSSKKQSKLKHRSKHGKLQKEDRQDETEEEGSQVISQCEQTSQKGMRQSRSTPNLKKKKSAKKGGSTSGTNSRRNSQEDLVIPHRSTSTSSSPAAMPRLKHMKSEPEIQRRHPQPSLQQQQLQYEWHRMQAYQREQQLKHQYAQQFQSYPPPMHHPHHPHYPPQAPAVGPIQGDPHAYHRSFQQDPRASAIMYPLPAVSHSASTPTNGFPHHSYYPLPQHTSYHYPHPSMR